MAFTLQSHIELRPRLGRLRLPAAVVAGSGAVFRAFGEWGGVETAAAGGWRSACSVLRISLICPFISVISAFCAVDPCAHDCSS